MATLQSARLLLSSLKLGDWCIAACRGTGLLDRLAYSGTTGTTNLYFAIAIFFVALLLTLAS